MAAFIDFSLAALTVAAALLGVRGVSRADQWSRRRRTWPRWRFGLRLVPQAILPAVAIGLFGVLPLVNGNSATPLDVFGLWPALMVLVLAGAGAGVAVTWRRLAARSGPEDQLPGDA